MSNAEPASSPATGADPASVQLEPKVEQSDAAALALLPQVLAGAEEVEQKRAAASTHLIEIQSLREKIETHLRSVEANAEQSATALSQTRSHEATLLELVTQAKTLVDALVAADTARADALAKDSETAAQIQEFATHIQTRKDEVDQSAQLAAQRSDHIYQGTVFVDKSQAEITKKVDTIEQDATKAKASLAKAIEASESATTESQRAVTAAANANSQADQAATARHAADAHVASCAKLAATADDLQRRIDTYSADVEELVNKGKEQQKRIDEILLGATNAGLAHAFDERGKSFKPQERLWNTVFAASILGLLGLAAWHARLLGSAAETMDWQQVLRMLVFKLPFALPLIWLAMHAARQATLAKRMEEEYAFKATTSMTFEGYRRQLDELEGDLVSNPALQALTSNTLTTIASPPARVYDKHRMDPTPATAAADMVKRARLGFPIGSSRDVGPSGSD
jgi:hypothetical protein